MKWTFDIKPEDVFWCTADIGWVTGHTYITYGPLAVGATEIVFEGIPTYPDAGRFWQTIHKHKCSVFYTAPTAIRSLIKASNATPQAAPKNYDLSSLRLLGSVGEPINPEAWMWYHENVGGGRCPIVDTFWQTETGGHMISPLPGVTALVPGSCTLPLPGIVAAIVDEAGHDVANGHGGILVVKKPWPAMIRTIWGDPDRYRKSYYPDELGGNLYLAGDGAVRDKTTGYFTIMGRIDDVLNVSGHRMGTMEIESALVANPIVAEAAVVGRPDDLTGEAVCAFVVLKQSRPSGAEAEKIAKQSARLGGQGNRSDREAEGHPLRRQPAQDALRKNHAPPSALDRQGRGHHARHLDAGKSGDPRTAKTGFVDPGAARTGFVETADRCAQQFAQGSACSLRRRRRGFDERHALAQLLGVLREIGVLASPVDRRMAQVEVAQCASCRDIGKRVARLRCTTRDRRARRTFPRCRAAFYRPDARSIRCFAVVRDAWSRAPR